MGLFGTKETREEKKARKEKELLEKYGLTDISQENIDSVKSIVSELAGTGLMKAGMTLSLAGKAEDILPVYYQKAMLEQNWIIIRQLERITKLIENSPN